jgi:hypothetical protein
MEASELGALLAVLGIGALVAFGQTSKHQMMGKWSTMLGLLTIPLGVAALWRLALAFGWWTILIFIVVSLVVGAVNGAFARSKGTATLYTLQPVIGTIALACIGASWALR